MKKILSYFFALSFLFYSNFASSQWVSTSATGAGASVSCFHSYTTSIYVGTFGNGIYKTSNFGVNWTALNSGLSNGTINGITSTPGGVGLTLFAATDDKVFKSTNDGLNWTYAGGFSGGNYTRGIGFAGGNLFVATLGAGLQKSTNLGVNWTAVGGILANEYLTCFASSGTNLYVGVSPVKGVYFSSDNGASWSTFNTGLTNMDVKCITVSGGYVYAGTISGIFKSGMNTANWSSMGPYYVNNIEVSGNNVFAATTIGIFMTTNNGLNWFSKNQGLPVSSPNVRCLLNTGGYIYAGYTNAVWKRSYVEIIDIKKISTEVPMKFKLDQNYPNPFNPNTTIRFDLPKKSAYEFKIYNILGMKVYEENEENLSPGSYNINLNMSTFASGIYFYTLRAGDFFERKQMILVK
ncbi:MAG: T9SS type A sorting domain-containing protein [Ignavibacteria bacterium]|nr:T9SS type A sorting domain-containing protein [Ignavibacteria bacterium]